MQTHQVLLESSSMHGEFERENLNYYVQGEIWKERIKGGALFDKVYSI